MNYQSRRHIPLQRECNVSAKKENLQAKRMHSFDYHRLPLSLSIPSRESEVNLDYRLTIAVLL